MLDFKLILQVQTPLVLKMFKCFLYFSEPIHSLNM